MRAISTDTAPAAISPYSQARVVGNLILAAGQSPLIPETGALAEGLEAQAEQVFTNIAHLLEAAGSDMGHVVKTTVFIKDMNDFGAINAIYARHFLEPFPARSCVEVARLPKDVLLECEVVAVVKE